MSHFLCSTKDGFNVTVSKKQHGKYMTIDRVLFFNETLTEVKLKNGNQSESSFCNKKENAEDNPLIYYFENNNSVGVLKKQNIHLVLFFESGLRIDLYNIENIRITQVKKENDVYYKLDIDYFNKKQCLLTSNVKISDFAVYKYEEDMRYDLIEKTLVPLNQHIKDSKTKHPNATKPKISF